MRRTVTTLLLVAALAGCKGDSEIPVVVNTQNGTGSREDPIRSNKVKKDMWCDALALYGIDRETGKLLLCQRADGKIQARWLPE